MGSTTSRSISFSTLALAAVLAGCGNSQGPGAGLVNPGNGNTAAPVSKFDLANRCFTLKTGGQYVVSDATGFIANASTAAGAERFYMKPAGLGRYLFYTKGEALLTGTGTAVTAETVPADGADITLDGDRGLYTAQSLDLPLSVDGSGRLLLGGTAAPLVFEPATGCSVYPEMPVGIDAPTFKNSINKPVIGFAEVHSHMGMGSEMSDGSGDVGPSAGGVLYGQAINRFGVVEALNSCEALHGPNGTLSAENIILDQNPTSTHDVIGWPTFINWPQNDSFLHQQMYYKWIERAWKAGLRTMTIHGTTIEALCNIARASYGDKMSECVDMEVGVQQVQYMYDVQDYVDAQEGGPGKGWFRIIKSPAEARAVIAEGKLAVILGLEFSNVFHCRVQFLPGGTEVSDCDEAEIDSEIDRAWELGVRQIFPYHDVDSSLGGTGIFSSILNYVGATDTKGFWKTYDCPDVEYFTGEGVFVAGAELETAPLMLGGDPLSQALISSGAGTAPIYPPGRQCNARGVTPLGKYAIDKILKKGFILDIDHAELSIKQYMLDEGAKLTPNYPAVSGHGGHGGITTAQAEQIFRQGGLIYQALGNGKEMTRYFEQMKPVWERSTNRPLALGYGADSNGLRTLPGPRGMDSEAIQYPFTLFKGPGWGPQYAAAGIAPMKVDMLAIPVADGKQWNMDEQGMSHYGLVPDIVEEIRIEGGEPATTALYNSAEAFLQMWEQTEKASADARTKPLP
ncbi:MAG: peptidase M19 [Pseudomonadota bacterium]